MVKNIIIEQNHTDFFIVLGYLTNPVRNTKLDIETPSKNHINIEGKYQDLTGLTLIPSNNYFILSNPKPNKYGSELRLYFHKSTNIPSILNSIIKKSRNPNGNRDARINNNAFIWDLIKFGFRASDTQDEILIRSKIPSNKLNDFNTGYVL